MRPFAWAVGVLLIAGARLPAAEVAWRHHAIEDPWGAAAIQAADFDGDQDCDFIAITRSGLSLVENAARGGRFVLHVIEATAAPADVAIPADLDGDGDLDLVTHALFWGGAIGCNENQGRGQVWPKHAILDKDVGSQVKALALADADSDRDLDLLIAGKGARWLANEDGSGGKWGSAVGVGDLASTTKAILLADFDGDGDSDAVASDTDQSAFVFAEKEGTSWTARRVLQKADHPAFLPSDVRAIDFDKDGDQDIFGVSDVGEIVLYENQDGKGQLASKSLAKLDGLVLARPADVDGDGDCDIVTACNAASDGIRWIENESANFAKLHDVHRDWELPTVLAAVDFDGDGDLDVVSISNDIDGKRTAWWENPSR
jgi:hypothetical protein